ncbi:hypothetical protein [Methylobacterium pseudosasicola]|uniref:Uncharacterized protein n=1 Tax=Methylobacterium pseudosasicola TaxID=582667 RepID=A0A1I4SDK3_9HYPH|nr:hypothetical protein [Methylobacterium pseudosasicola]SFM62401.1 hypothetical protein SAMN05192568_104159 [Methylobacterium pseudosasicola]
MPLARAIIGTLGGIPRALALAETEVADLYAVATALQAAHNAVMDVALDVIALEEGRRLVAERRRPVSSHREGGPAE